ncbi:MAG TPA: GTPase [Noviherbaspirillum sp.]|nr:GTPase [Noviherbaspirillum sp.]
MTLTTLVTGATIAAREAAIAAALDSRLHTALILEGIPDGASPLEALAQDPELLIARIAPGCLCCTGNLTMRVTLNRLLRRSPERLYIAVANAKHIESLRTFLLQAPYDHLLSLTKDLHT